MTRLRVGVLRALPVGVGVFLVFLVVNTLPAVLVGRDVVVFTVLLPFLAAAVCAFAVRAVLGPVDRFVERITRLRATTPYSVLAEAAARTRTGMLDTALPGLAEVLAGGTAARRAVIWVVVSDRLVAAAVHPPPSTPFPEVANIAVLLDRPDVDHVVPIVEGDVLRAALTIAKPGASITVADQRLMRDVASEARLLLQGVALATELRERVRQAAELGSELQHSRWRLTRARDLERRRLATELGHVTTGRLAVVRRLLDGVRADLLADRTEEAVAEVGVVRARLDELLERFRSIARGVYPSVLRDQGLAAALEELVVDLPREVDLRGAPDRRYPWEVESGIYYFVASAVHWLAENPGPPIEVTLSEADRRLSVEIVDAHTELAEAELQAALANDLERLAALGGAVDLARTESSVVLRAYLPEQLEPIVGARS
jgi:signal transduction histidine kinase